LIVFAFKCAWFGKTINKNNDKSRLLIIGSQVRALVRPPSSLAKSVTSEELTKAPFCFGTDLAPPKVTPKYIDRSKFSEERAMKQIGGLLVFLCALLGPAAWFGLGRWLLIS
jgi:hypothetical protein